jgi:hypothetical protein
MDPRFLPIPPFLTSSVIREDLLNIRPKQLFQNLVKLRDLFRPNNVSDLAVIFLLVIKVLFLDINIEFIIIVLKEFEFIIDKIADLFKVFRLGISSPKVQLINVRFPIDTVF